MSEPMQRFLIPVRFEGEVAVFVPSLGDNVRAERLAEKVALSRVLATLENPDAPEDDACAEYENEFDLSEEQAEKDWNACETRSIGGGWEIGRREPAQGEEQGVHADGQAAWMDSVDAMLAETAERQNGKQ